MAFSNQAPIRNDGGVLQFQHKTLQEYLAAACLHACVKRVVATVQQLGVDLTDMVHTEVSKEIEEVKPKLTEELAVPEASRDLQRKQVHIFHIKRNR